ncbi:MAG: TetR family transcriptional regulator [Proteobacteria bacterium]|nr:TetR family transcriptional regulator [Pseudomonadota bacterium]
MLEISQELFRKQGFDASTLEEICDRAQISKRTFFRYFRDKESLVFPNREQRLEDFESFLQLPLPQENPFDTLRKATRLYGAEYNSNRVAILAQQSLVHGSGHLLAREAEIDRDWERQIALAFARKVGGGESVELWSRVMAGAIMGVVRSTMSYWFERNCEDNLVDLGLDAIDKLEKGFPIGPS